MSTKMILSYADTFRKLQPTHDPRHIEAFIRLEYSTLNHLDLRTIKREANIAAECIAYCAANGQADHPEWLAVSFGL